MSDVAAPTTAPVTTGVPASTPAPTPATAAPEAAPKTQEEAERISPKFAALAKKEAAAYRKIQEATTKEGQLKAREEQLAAREAKLAEFEKLKTDPIKALDYIGTDYSKLTELMLNGGNKTPETVAAEIAEKKIADWQAKQEAEQQEKLTKQQLAAKEQAELAEKEAITGFLKQTDDFLEQKKDAYPLTHMYKRSDLVYDVIDSHYKQTLEAARKVNPSVQHGEVMAPEDAIKLVENHLRTEAEKVAAVLNRAQAQTAPAPAPKPVERNQVWAEKPIKTLSNVMQPSTASQPTRLLSDDDRMRNALARFRASRGG